MSRGTRWLVAGGVTATAFAVPTLVCGAWVLPALVADAGARWGVASALGAAVAALTVLWGQGFAATGGGRTAPVPGAATVHASGVRAVAVGGSVRGDISTGDGGGRGAAPSSAGPAPAPDGDGGVPAALPPDPASAVPGSVVASGERSVAVGGGVAGAIFTGDRTEGGSGT
ncbi:hypothetical protein ACFRI7_37195 [Streptomyces sp. NPDC056716]|uniref:hypothetical protein n=1 Tax=unclassified Streptomyces TaxID=2593676 RepID=UPI00368605A3